MCGLRDDKPVECTCGCIVYSGWVFEESITVMHRGKPKTVKYTHCDNDDCAAKAMRYALDIYAVVEETLIQTAYDKECEMNDE